MPLMGRRDFLGRMLGGGAATRLACRPRVARTDDDHTIRSVTWARLDRSGAEICWLSDLPTGPLIRGVVVGADEGQPLQGRYSVACTPGWITRRVDVEVLGGDGGRRAITLEQDHAGRWRVDGRARPDLRPCTDVDLGITPATNTLPVRRLRLAEREEASVVAAWVRFPDLTVRPLPQTYRRLGRGRYRYESRGGAFTAELEVDDQGLVERYGDLWARVAEWPGRLSAAPATPRSRRPGTDSARGRTPAPPPDAPRERRRTRAR